MAITEDRSDIGAHAHTNLLGRITSAIFGGYYALNRRKAERRMAMVQYYVYTAGVAVMVLALYLMLLGNMAMEPIVAAASVVTFIGVLLFAFIIFSDERATATISPAPSR